jgi:methylenetetrahydrofolate reductase (NADPH)
LRIAERLAEPRPTFSFEFFPPRTAAAAEALEAAIGELSVLCPDFVSITYGAGGSTRDRTVELASRIKRELGIEAMAHLTCVGHGRSDLRAIVEALQAAGIENIMALRGDPPAGAGAFEPPPDGFSHGSELIGFIRDAALGFCLGGAAYPEGHLESPDRHVDLRYLLEKQRNGASFFVTQLFFENAVYFDFVERARAAGVTAPILAGIMPLENADQIRRFCQRCGATIPIRLAVALERCADDVEVRALGVAWATDQCRELLMRGAAGIHFYTLNRSRATREILAAIRGR